MTVYAVYSAVPSMMGGQEITTDLFSDLADAVRHAESIVRDRAGLAETWTEDTEFSPVLTNIVRRQWTEEGGEGIVAVTENLVSPRTYSLSELWDFCYKEVGEFSAWGNGCAAVDVLHRDEILRKAGVPEGLEPDDPCCFVYGGIDYQESIDRVTEEVANERGYRFDEDGNIINR